MKKYIGFLMIFVFVLLGFAISTPVNGDWVKITTSKKPGYSVSYVYDNGNCVVSVRNDRQGVKIESHAPDKGLSEIIEIEGNSIKKYYTSKYFNQKTTEIFGKKYKEAAKDLPPEVRKAFMGQYGLGYKPMPLLMPDIKDLKCA